MQLTDLTQIPETPRNAQDETKTVLPRRRRGAEKTKYKFLIWSSPRLCVSAAKLFFLVTYTTSFVNGFGLSTIVIGRPLGVSFFLV